MCVCVFYMSYMSKMNLPHSTEEVAQHWSQLGPHLELDSAVQGCVTLGKNPSLPGLPFPHPLEGLARPCLTGPHMSLP